MDSIDTSGIPLKRIRTQITLDEQMVSRSPSCHTELRDTTPSIDGTASASLVDRTARPTKGTVKTQAVPLKPLPDLGSRRRDVNTHSPHLLPAAQSPHDDPHIAEQETFHIVHSGSGGGNSGNTASLTSQAAWNDSVANDPLHPPTQGRTGTSTPARTAPEVAPLPAQQTPNTGAPPPQRDAADAYLNLTQRYLRQRSVEDSLERGTTRNWVEAETELPPLVGLDIFGPRLKKMLVVVVLVVMLIGAAVKIPQTILSQSNSH
ncbi:hypothetical protein FRC05_003428 [Tulasnella sp. 425]|nr:hypothetical protein FRC05_003428 [Tulasnella sp. 425]